MSVTKLESSYVHYEISQRVDGNLELKNIQRSDESLITFAYKELRKHVEIKRCVCDEILNVSKYSQAFVYSHAVMFKIISADNVHKKFEVRLFDDGFDLHLITVINVI
jgi:hypothetical protein